MAFVREITKTRDLCKEIGQLSSKYRAYKESPTEVEKLEIICIATELVVYMNGPNFNAQLEYLMCGERVHLPENILNELGGEWLKQASIQVTTPFSENPAKNAVPPCCRPGGMCSHSHSQPVASAAASNSQAAASDSKGAASSDSQTTVPLSPQVITRPPSGPSLSSNGPLLTEATTITSTAAITDVKGTAIVSPATASFAGPALSPAAFFSQERNPATATDSHPAAPATNSSAVLDSSKAPAKK